MKVTPMAAPNAIVENAELGHSAGSDRIARAKAIAEGQPITQTQAQSTDPQVERAQTSIKRIKLKTQRSTNRHDPVIAAPEVPATAPDAPVATTEAPVSDVLATDETKALAASEETKPLSPQFAALAKAKRALQVKEREILAREAALAGKSPETAGTYTKEQLQANALGILGEAGVTYDQLTEAILAQNQVNPELSELKAQIQALKEELNKNFTDRDEATEKQVLTQIRSDVDQLIAEGDEYEAVREAGYAPKVVDLIHRTFKKSGEILDITEAASLIENELIEESLKFARLKKVQSKLTPAQTTQQLQAATQSTPNTKVMRTLTNRDGASALSSPRERAIAAFHGKLK